MRKLTAVYLLVLLSLSACAAPAQTSEAPSQPATLLSQNIDPPALQSGEPEPQSSDAPQGAVKITSLVRHYGAFPLDGQKPVNYDIQVYGSAEDGVGFYVALYFRFGPSELQAIRYDLGSYPYIDSMNGGLVILDVNGDGYMDITLDIGASGHISQALCYVFDPEQYEYIPVTDFDHLASPSLCLSQTGEVFVVADDTPGHLEPAPDGSWERWSRYRVEGSQLALVDYLHSDDMQELRGSFLT